MQKRYNAFSDFLKQTFPGERVRKIPVHAGFPCPNKNGVISREGCIFCDEYGSGPVRTFSLSIREQIRTFTERSPLGRFIVYYQAFSNTFAPLEELREKYEIVFEFPGVVGLFVGTRPDAIAPEAYALLEEMSRRTWLTVELGLQSPHAKSLAFLNRNHTWEQFLEAYGGLKQRGIEVVVHLIMGIPGESRGDMMDTVAMMNALKPEGIKFHLLHVLKNTGLFNLYEREKFPLLEQGEYVELMADVLERLHPEIVIHRLTGERDRELFHAPEWTLRKAAVIEAIRRELERRNTCQGSRFDGAAGM